MFEFEKLLFILDQDSKISYLSRNRNLFIIFQHRVIDLKLKFPISETFDKYIFKYN